MKKVFETIEKISSEQYKHYGNVFSKESPYDVHNAATQMQIVEMLAQLIGKVDELIQKLPSQINTEDVKTEPAESVVVDEKKTTKTTQRKTTASRKKTQDPK